MWKLCKSENSYDFAGNSLKIECENYVKVKVALILPEIPSKLNVKLCKSENYYDFAGNSLKI